MAIHGTLGPFDLVSGDSTSFFERAELYFIANDITDVGKQWATLLSSCRDATYHCIKDVISPRNVFEVSFKDICAAVTMYLQPKPSEIVQ